MKNEFIIESSNPNQTGGFVTKLSRTETVETEFGSKTKKETYYVSGSKQMEKGKSIAIDLDSWRIAEYPFELTEGENAGSVIMLKWLHLK